TDPVSAFGSVIAFNREVDADAAERMRGNFIEGIVAPAFSAEALEILRERKNLRLLELAPGGDAGALDFRAVRGGVLVQHRMGMAFPETEWRVVSERQPDGREWEDLRFAWRAV